jgi:hypothetical protein
MCFRFIFDWFSPPTPPHPGFPNIEDIDAAYSNAINVYRHLRALEWWLKLRNQTDCLAITQEFREAMECENWGENPQVYLKKYASHPFGPEKDEALYTEDELPKLPDIVNWWRVWPKIEQEFWPLWQFDLTVRPSWRQVDRAVQFLIDWMRERAEAESASSNPEDTDDADDGDKADDGGDADNGDEADGGSDADTLLEDRKTK